jgi:phytoene dehydrogenase-like protein
METHVPFRALLDQLLLITVQETADNAAYLNGCVGLDIWRHGAYRPHGGMRALSDALLKAFRRDGGDARFKQRVTRVQPVRGGGFNVTNRRGETFLASKVIANVPATDLPGLLVPTPAPRPERHADTVTPRMLRAAERAAGGWGAFNLYIGLNAAVLPGDGWLHHQVLQSYGAGYEDGESVFLSLSAPGDTVSAPVGHRTLNLSTHTGAAGWFDLSLEDYRERKNAVKERMLAAARMVIPNLDAGVRVIETGSPRSWKIFTQRSAVGGLRGTPDRVNLNALHRQEIGLPGFWLVGDTTFPGQGTVAATLSGVNAWRDIAGR